MAQNEEKKTLRGYGFDNETKLKDECETFRPQTLLQLIIVKLYIEVLIRSPNLAD
jgi:hypothetical protein